PGPIQRWTEHTEPIVNYLFSISYLDQHPQCAHRCARAEYFYRGENCCPRWINCVGPVVYYASRTDSELHWLLEQYRLFRLAWLWSWRMGTHHNISRAGDGGCVIFIQRMAKCDIYCCGGPEPWPQSASLFSSGHRVGHVALCFGKFCLFACAAVGGQRNWRLGLGW